MHKKIILSFFSCILALFSLSSGSLSYAATPEEIEKAVKGLDTIEKAEKSKAMEEIIAYDNDAVDQLLAVAKNSKNVVSWRSKCAYALGEIKHPKSVEDLITLVSDEKTPSRLTKESARALGKIGDKRAMPALIKLLDGEEGIRFYALEAIGKIGDTNISYRISDILSTDTNEKIRAEAIRILDAWDAKSESGVVMNSLSDSDPYVRGYAAQLCAIWNNKGALPKIITMLKYDSSDVVKVSAGQALGVYKDMSAVPELIDTLDHMNTEIRITAASSLRRISGKDFGYDCDKWQKWYNEAKTR